jgi:hypothetical protein
MDDPTPVFVIHGVNVKRDEAAYANEVRRLNTAVGKQWRFIPIYWADLGGNDKYIEVTIPHSKASVTAESLLGGLLVNSAKVDAETAANIAADAAAARVALSMHAQVANSVRAPIREEWEETEVLSLIRDADLAREIGKAIGDAIAAGRSKLILKEAPVVARGVVQAFGYGFKALVSIILARLNELLRRKFGPTIARFLGDVFVHRSTPTCIDDRLLGALKKEGYGTEGNPAIVLGHSFGGVIAFTLAARKSNPIYLRKFVTFGSQSAFFHVIQPIGLVGQFLGKPIALPPTLHEWLNVWEPIDPLAFLAGTVFRLHSGGSPKDLRMKHASGGSLWTHSSYWKDKSFAKSVAGFLSA